jgi:branched-chain amino acid transport system substrate-binding protein
MKDTHQSTAISRRLFVGSTLAAGSLALAGRAALAEGTDKLRVGFISPRTGPLAGFGKTDGHVLDLARKALEAGLQIKGKTYSVEILDRDTQSDPARAAQLAKELISEGVDMMLAISTPEVVNPVADACEAAGVPCLSTVMPWEAWYFGRGAKPGQPNPFKWGFHYSFGVNELAKAYLAAWSKVETNRKVGVMYPNDADGNAVRALLAPQLAAAGYTIVDPGAYETGTTDFSTQIALFKSEGVEILNSFPIPPDFATFMRQAAQQGLTKKIKINQTSKTGLFPSDAEAMGPLGTNMASGAYWHRDFPYTSSLTGLSGRQLCDGWEAATSQQWTIQLGATLSLLDAGVEALKASSDPKSKEALRDALEVLDVVTIAGRVNFKTGPVPHVAFGPAIVTQWVKAAQGPYALDYIICDNATDPNVPITANLAPYNG